MAASTFVYNNAAKHLTNGDTDYLTDDITVSLHSSSYTPNLATHEFFDDVSNELTTANGYTAGGATLGSKAIVVSGSDTQFDAAATTWTAGDGETLTARYAIVRHDTGTDSTSPLLAYVLLDSTPGDVSATNAAFTITWNADGVFKISANPS